MRMLLTGTPMPTLRRSLLAVAALAALVLAIGGCGGDHLYIDSPMPGRAYIIPDGGEPMDLGPTPVEWEVPRGFYGARVTVKVVFANGAEHMSWIVIRKDDDTYVRAQPPPRPVR